MESPQITEEGSESQYASQKSSPTQCIYETQKGERRSEMYLKILSFFGVDLDPQFTAAPNRSRPQSALDLLVSTGIHVMEASVVC